MTRNKASRLPMRAAIGNKKEKLRQSLFLPKFFAVFSFFCIDQPENSSPGIFFVGYFGSFILVLWGRKKGDEKFFQLLKIGEKNLH